MRVPIGLSTRRMPVRRHQELARSLDHPRSHVRATVRVSLALLAQEAYPKYLVRSEASPRAAPNGVGPLGSAGTTSEAVLDAYGWPRDLSDAEVLERLLALNLRQEAVR